MKYKTVSKHNGKVGTNKEALKHVSFFIGNVIEVLDWIDEQYCGQSGLLMMDRWESIEICPISVDYIL